VRWAPGGKDGGRCGDGGKLEKEEDGLGGREETEEGEHVPFIHEGLIFVDLSSNCFFICFRVCFTTNREGKQKIGGFNI
jgi:hypothetical protein